MEEPGIYLRVAVPCPEVLLVVWPIGNVVGLRPTKPFKMSRWAAKALRSFLFSSADCRVPAQLLLEIIDMAADSAIQGFPAVFAVVGTDSACTPKPMSQEPTKSYTIL